MYLDDPLFLALQLISYSVIGLFGISVGIVFSQLLKFVDKDLK